MKPDGTLTQSGKNLLSALENASTPEEISRKLGQSLFQVRANLREMVHEGLLRTEGERYRITEKGKGML